MDPGRKNRLDTERLASDSKRDGGERSLSRTSSVACPEESVTVFLRCFDSFGS
jgi:hypothetical protein